MTGGSYSIGVYSYTGDNAVAFTDFDAPATFFLGSFSTAGMAVGQQFSFDVTAAFNAGAGGSLGIRLQATTEPGQTSYTFNNFELDTAPAATVPEPSTVLMVGTGLFGAAGRYRRRRAAVQPTSRIHLPTAGGAEPIGPALRERRRSTGA
jgi:hypothetical protein